MRQAVEIARRALNISAEPLWSTMPNRQWDFTSCVGDNRKICAQLGWRPRFDFEQGFRRMLEWFQTDTRAAFGNGLAS